MTNLESIFKNRHYFANKGPSSQGYGFFHWSCMDVESWTVKKAEHRRVDAFELWCWRRLLRVSWTVRRSNQSILKEISPGCSLEGLILKLKLHTLATWSEELTPWKRHWYSVQLLSRVWLFATPWTAACQASLSITKSQSPPKPMSISFRMDWLDLLAV